MKITVLGDPIIKKNTKKFSCRGGYPRTYYSKRWLEWEEYALIQLKMIKVDTYKTLSTISLKFFPKTARRFDLTNMAEGIQDVLVKAEIIADDSWKVMPKVIIEFGGIDKTNPRTEVEIR